MPNVRTFIAAELPGDVLEEVAQVQKRLAAAGAKLKAVRAVNMHLTLKFVGDFEESLLADLCDAVSRAASAVDPFDVAFSGVGAFPNTSNPRVVYIGCADDPPGSIAMLHEALEQELEPLGVQSEGRSFTPHLTLARVKASPKGTDLSAAIERFSGFSAGSCHVEDLSVFLSDLTPEGPVYTRAGRAPLGGRPTIL